MYFRNIIFSLHLRRLIIRFAYLRPPLAVNMTPRESPQVHHGMDNSDHSDILVVRPGEYGPFCQLPCFSPGGGGDAHGVPVS